jgi:alkaline phosphatase D
MMRFLADRKPANPIVVTGDIHSSWVSDLKVQWKDEKAPAVGSEFIGTSISSGGDGSEEQAQTAAWYSENPHLKMYNNRRGYMLLTLDQAQCRTDYRTVEYVTKPGAPIRTQSSWIVENGRRGVQKA